MTDNKKFATAIITLYTAVILFAVWSQAQVKNMGYKSGIIGMAEPTRVWPIVPFSCESKHRWPCTFDENGHYHSKNDLPAAGDFFGVYWHKHGVIHRVGGPAAIMHQGDKYWYENGKLIRYEFAQ